MEKIMRLTYVSSLMSRTFEDSQTGGEVTIKWLELTLTDGVDTVIGELVIPKARGTSAGDEPEIPKFAYGIYGISAELKGVSGVTKDGQYWSRNRCVIKNIVAL